MWYILRMHNGILFSYKKEGSPAICDNVEEIEGHYVKGKKTDRERHAAWYHLHVESKK